MSETIETLGTQTTVNVSNEESDKADSVAQDSTKIKPTNIDTHILPFQAIFSFVTSMNEHLGSKDKPLRMYSRLLEQTKFSHEIPIKKHIQAFTKFCIANRDAIYGKKFDKFVEPRITYSERVYIDLKKIFELADREQRKVIWEHILTISALVDSTGRAKQILKNAKAGKNENNFLSKIIEKIEKNVNLEESKNPFDIVNQLLSSGVFTDIIGSMNEQINNGELNMASMLGVVQSMLSSFTKDQPEVNEMVNNFMKSMEKGEMPDLSALTSLLGGGEGSEGVPDLSALAGLMGGLSQGGSGGNGVQNISDLLNGIKQLPDNKKL